ncbi:Protein of unknown function [Cotesia congregata]|uniref:Uncharacterized protein n=1 Tax=Cotesia congregata TaxID=51543 RepID=A0A8J2EFZ8_COTCN|nr:Protein of unknown function [Cotesia congregata]
MARFAYECNDDIKLNDTNYESNIRTYMCPAEKSYCLYCCCNPQDVLRNIFGKLGTSGLISTYIVSNCRYGFNLRTTSNNLQVPSLSGTRINDELNEISIHVIPTTDILLSTSHIKMQLAAPQPNAIHMSKSFNCGKKNV